MLVESFFSFFVCLFVLFLLSAEAFTVFRMGRIHGRVGTLTSSFLLVFGGMHPLFRSSVSLLVWYRLSNYSVLGGSAASNIGCTSPPSVVLSCKDRDTTGFSAFRYVITAVRLFGYYFLS
jgi:hypothetical protein